MSIRDTKNFVGFRNPNDRVFAAPKSIYQKVDIRQVDQLSSASLGLRVETESIWYVKTGDSFNSSYWEKTELTDELIIQYLKNAKN